MLRILRSAAGSILLAGAVSSCGKTVQSANLRTSDNQPPSSAADFHQGDASASVPGGTENGEKSRASGDSDINKNPPPGTNNGGQNTTTNTTTTTTTTTTGNDPLPAPPPVQSFQLALPIECCLFSMRDVYMRQCVEFDLLSCSKMPK